MRELVSEAPALGERPPPPAKPEPPTSLSREASRCKGLSDMRNCLVVSAVGWGPGLSGAYCTFLMTRRTEFLVEMGRAKDDQSHLPPSSFLATLTSFSCSRDCHGSHDLGLQSKLQSLA